MRTGGSADSRTAGGTTERPDFPRPAACRLDGLYAGLKPVPPQGDRGPGALLVGTGGAGHYALANDGLGPHPTGPGPGKVVRPPVHGGRGPVTVGSLANGA